MRVGNYTVLIPEGVERDSGHVALEHGRQYTVRLISHDHRRCDAEVTVDGKAVGGFRLHGGGSLTLERSPNDHGRFTFYSSGTGDAAAAGEAGVPHVDKGLVQVRFVPERRRPEPTRGSWIPTSALRYGAGGQSAGGAAAGGGLLRSAAPHFDKGAGVAPKEKTCGGITGLSGHSSQQFVTVADIERDEAEAVTITLRLVTLAGGPRELRPNADRANPVPAPVG